MSRNHFHGAKVREEIIFMRRLSHIVNSYLTDPGNSSLACAMLILSIAPQSH